MPTWAKVLLIIGAILLLLLIGLAAMGVYLWREYGQGMLESGQQAMSQGAEFGSRTDNEGCVAEGVARHRQASGFGELIKTNLFLRGCLEASAPTPGFCDGVPSQTDFIEAAKWQKRQCDQHGLSVEKQCTQLFSSVQTYCERKR